MNRGGARTPAIAGAAAGLWLLAGGEAAAHAFGRSYTLPVPFWLYAWAAGVTLLLSFLAAALLLRATPAPPPPPRRFCADSRWQQRLFGAARTLSVGLLALCIVTGAFGHPNSNVNLSMTLFWIGFAIGFAYFSALLGGLYERLSPWRVLADCGGRRLREGCLRYPAERFAYWPAVILYLGFIALELFGDLRPGSLAAWLLAYTLLNLLACALIGARSWFGYGEFFAVMLRLFSRLAPLALERHEGRWVWTLRRPLRQLEHHRADHGSLVVFMLCMLATTAFDGLHETRPWLRWFWSTLLPLWDPDVQGQGLRALVLHRDTYERFQWAGLLLMPLLYCAAYGLAVALGRWLAGARGSLAAELRRYGLALLPIVLAYHFAHYATLLWTQGGALIWLVSDPFGWGWDLFGTRQWFQRTVIPDPRWVWHLQVASIVLGHVLSVVLAHRIALHQYRSPRRTALNQLPMLALMVRGFSKSLSKTKTSGRNGAPAGSGRSSL